MNKIRNYKQNTIALYFFVFSLGLIISFIVIDMIYLSEKSHNLIIDNLVKEAYEKQLDLNDSLNDSKDILNNINTSKYYREFLNTNDPLYLKDIFSLVIHSNKKIFQISYLDKNGSNKIGITKQGVVLHNQKNHLENFDFNNSKYTNTILFDSIKSIDLNTTILTTILIVKKDSNFNGIIVLNYLIDNFDNLNSNSSLYDFILFDQKQEIINRKSFNKKINISTNFLNNQKEKVLESKKFIALKLELPIKNLLLVVKLKDSFLDKQYKEKIDRYLVVSVLVLVLSILLSIFFSRYFQKLNLLLRSTLRQNTNLDEEIKTKTKELKDSKKRITEILDNITDFVWQVDKNGVYTYASPQVKDILGYKAKDIIGKTPFDFMDEDEAKRISDIFGKIVEKKVPIKDLVNKNIHKNGEDVWLETNGNPIIDEAGNLLGYRGTDRDITKRKEQANQISKINNELKELNKNLENRVKEEIEKNKLQEVQLFNQAKMAAMGDMLGNIAHQWRQPLSYISTTASGIKLNYEFDILNKEEIPHAMDEIVSRTQYLSQTIETFRNFLMEKKEYQEAILQDRVEIALNIVNATLKDNHIYLEKIMDYTKPINTKIVVGELSEVIINIINNAKDILIIRNIPNPWIIVELSQVDNTAYLSIEDNAGGIEENVIDRIFEPYFTTKDLSVGTGLGLYMSYKIVKESLKGKLSVQNSEFGAKFIIELPIVNS